MRESGSWKHKIWFKEKTNEKSFFHFSFSVVNAIFVFVRFSALGHSHLIVPMKFSTLSLAPNVIESEFSCLSSDRFLGRDDIPELFARIPSMEGKIIKNVSSFPFDYNLYKREKSSRVSYQSSSMQRLQIIIQSSENSRNWVTSTVDGILKICNFHQIKSRCVDRRPAVIEIYNFFYFFSFYWIKSIFRRYFLNTSHRLTWLSQP